MKKFKYMVVMIAFVVCNLFLCQSVNALESNVLEYQSAIDTLIKQVNDSFTGLKNSDEYHDSKVKVLATYFEELFTSKVGNYRKMINSVETIDLETIVNASNDEELKLKYKEHGENIVISIYSIADVFYKDDSTSLLISKEEIHRFFVEKYFEAYYDLFLDYSSNFRNYVFSNEHLYDEIFLEINSGISLVNGIFGEITQFEQEELALGNNPVMIIDKVNVYDSLNHYIGELNQLKSTMDLQNPLGMKRKIDSIVSEVEKLKKIFFDKNASYQDSGLKEKIEDVDNHYDTIRSDLEKKNDVFDKETIKLYKEVISFEDDYVNLYNEINHYLIRKSSDTFLINALTLRLRTIYQSLNKGSIVKIIEDRILKETFDDIKTVELYEQLLDIDCLSDYYKQIIRDARKRLEEKKKSKSSFVVKREVKQKKSVTIGVSNIEKNESDLYELPELSNNENQVVMMEDEEVVDWVNIFKISLIVFLGALIIYFLNKGEEELMEAK